MRCDPQIAELPDTLMSDHTLYHFHDPKFLLEPAWALSWQFPTSLLPVSPHVFLASAVSTFTVILSALLTTYTTGNPPTFHHGIEQSKYYETRNPSSAGSLGGSRWRNQ